MFDKIFNEDCLDGMARIPEKSIDAIICDLPYGKTKCSWDIPMQQLWPIWWRICKENAPIVLLKNNRHFIGFELEKKYYDIAMKRIKEAQQTIF